MSLGFAMRLLGFLSQASRPGNPFFFAGWLTLAVSVVAEPTSGGVFRQSPCNGDQPVAVVAADVDSDGLTDLISVNRSSRTVSVAIGTGNGAFREPRSYSVAPPAAAPSAVTVADLNRDGNLDLIVTTDPLQPPASPSDPAFSSIFALFGLGSGSNFQQPRRLMQVRNGSALPLTFALGDLTGDGRDEMAVAVPASEALSLFKLEDNGTLASLAGLLLCDGSRCPGPGGAGPTSIGIGDLNGDGLPDLAVARTNGSVSVAFGDGRGAFPRQGYLPGIGRTLGALSITDVDGDGRDEILTTDFRLGLALLLRGNAAGQFTTAAMTAGDQPVRAIAADVTGDSLPDILAVNRFPDTVSVLVGRRDGSYSGPEQFPVGQDPVDLAVGDFDQDGRPDLVTANSADDDCSILVNAPETIFARNPCQAPGRGEGPIAVEARDLNRDGRSDLAVLHFYSDDLLVVPRLAGFRFATPASYAVIAAPRHLLVGDVDLDGVADLLVSTISRSTSSAEPERIGLLRTDGQAGLVQQSIVSNDTGGGGIALGDLNGDGHPDLIAAGKRSVTLFTGNGRGSFTPSAPQLELPAGAEPSGICAGDIDRDGRLDVVTANRTTRNISVFFADDRGRFAARRDHTLPGRPSAVLVADATADGSADLVVAVDVDTTTPREPDLVVVLVGNGQRSFDTRTLTVGADPQSILVRDVTGDAVADLVVVNRLNNSISLLAGRGNGEFEPAVSFRVGDVPSDLALADLNDDGRPDAITPNLNGNDCTILLNESDHPFVFGDLDGDAIVDSADVARLPPELFDGDGDAAELAHEGWVMLDERADPNRDRRVTAADLVWIARRAHRGTP